MLDVFFGNGVESTDSSSEGFDEDVEAFFEATKVFMILQGGVDCDTIYVKVHSFEVGGKRFSEQHGFLEVLLIFGIELYRY